MRNAPPTFLALPAPGDDTQARFVGNLRRLALNALMSRAELGPVRATLAGVHAAAPDRLLAAIGRVDVLTPLLIMHRGGDALAQLRAAVPTLLAALADAFPHDVAWEHPVARVVAGDRVLDCDPPAARLVAGGGAWRLDGATPRERRPFHPLPPSPVHLSELDTNPLAMTEAHPDKLGNALDLGGRAVSEWVERLGHAFAIVQAALPDWFAELPATLERIVPVGWHDERHESASYAEAPGLAYLTLHPNPLTLAEAIVHETQHGKLNTVLYFDPLLDNAATEWARSEVRPDLRPLGGVLLAVHAFVPVAAMHAALAAIDHPLARDPGFERRRRDVIGQNARGLDTLTRLGKPTPLGARLLDGLAALHAFTASAS
jgi:HEXXH motif-containing protein